jgi:hypothetical protein
MWRTLLTVLAIIVVLVATPFADDCGPQEPIQVSAVCGRTLLLVGGLFDVPEGKPYAYAEVFSRQHVQLWRGERKVAETMSDGNGRFMFPPVDKGSYRLTVPYVEFFGINSMIVVMKNRAARCDTPLFLYLGDKGWPCRAHASVTRPLKLSADSIHKMQ